MVDEAQYIKNHKTKNAQIVKKLNADYRLALTGTPLENNVSELWSMFDFLMPGFLGSAEQFARQYHKPIMERGDMSALTQLQKKVAPFVLRRTKAEVLSELPPKVEQVCAFPLSPAQNILYQQILVKVRGEVFDAVSHLYLSGKTRNRQQMVDTFNTDRSIPIFLISLKAGGLGLNLTAADTVIIFDPWWNPSVENQAIDRTHRIGQKKTVNVYRLLTTGTIEEKIQALKVKKQRLFDAVVNESGDLFLKTHMG